MVKHLANDLNPKSLYKVSPSTKGNVKIIVKLAIESGAIRRTINQLSSVRGLKSNLSWHQMKIKKTLSNWQLAVVQVIE